MPELELARGVGYVAQPLPLSVLQVVEVLPLAGLVVEPVTGSSSRDTFQDIILSYFYFGRRHEVNGS